jgi:isopropylmalate/homocitrate/citramalate synthase
MGDRIGAPRVRLYDTTLADGERGASGPFTIPQKLEILAQLARLSLDHVELGEPAASDDAARWIERAATMPLDAVPAVLVRADDRDIETALEATDRFARMQFQLTGGDLSALDRAVGRLARAGRTEIGVLVEAMDVPLVESLEVTSVTIADPRGGALPSEIAAVIADLDDVETGVRAWNDLGLATANAIAAVEAGASVVHATIGGIGERAGMCALEEVAAILAYKLELYTVELPVLIDVAQRIARILGRTYHATKPLLGECAFTANVGRKSCLRPDDFGRRGSSPRLRSPGAADDEVTVPARPSVR